MSVYYQRRDAGPPQRELKHPTSTQLGLQGRDGETRQIRRTRADRSLNNGTDWKSLSNAS